MRETQYYKIAKEAARRIKVGNSTSEKDTEKILRYREVWDEVAEEIAKSKSSKEKSCPRGAFLGLILGHPCVNKNGSINKNAQYALAALEILKEGGKEDKKYLWESIKEIRTAQTHNGQMDVLLALWKDEELQEYFLNNE
jgi:hypothetical protein